jgi:hypothetical protein
MENWDDRGSHRGDVPHHFARSPCRQPRCGRASGRSRHLHGVTSAEVRPGSARATRDPSPHPGGGRRAWLHAQPNCAESGHAQEHDPRPDHSERGQRRIRADHPGGRIRCSASGLCPAAVGVHRSGRGRFGLQGTRPGRASGRAADRERHQPRLAAGVAARHPRQLPRAGYAGRSPASSRTTSAGWRGASKS